MKLNYIDHFNYFILSLYLIGLKNYLIIKLYLIIFVFLIIGKKTV